MTLSEQELEARLKAWMEYDYPGKHSGMIAELWAFDAGFKAGVTYGQKRIEELEAEVKRLRAAVRG